jgi:hypothetical protein
LETIEIFITITHELLTLHEGEVGEGDGKTDGEPPCGTGKGEGKGDGIGGVEIVGVEDGNVGVEGVRVGVDVGIGVEIGVAVGVGDWRTGVGDGKIRIVGDDDWGVGELGLAQVFPGMVEEGEQEIIAKAELKREYTFVFGFIDDQTAV